MFPHSSTVVWTLRLVLRPQRPSATAECCFLLLSEQTLRANHCCNLTVQPWTLSFTASEILLTLSLSQTHTYTLWDIVDCWPCAGRVVQSPIQSVNEANLKFSDRPFITKIARRSWTGRLKMCCPMCVCVCWCDRQQQQQLPRKFLFHSISLMGADSQTPLWRREREGKKR